MRGGGVLTPPGKNGIELLLSGVLLKEKGCNYAGARKGKFKNHSVEKISTLGIGRGDITRRGELVAVTWGNMK